MSVRKVVCVALAMTVVPWAAWAGDAEVDMPVVPASVVAKTGPAPMDQALLKPEVLTVRPGVVQLVPIAIGHINRLVMPFDQPEIHTTATDFKTQIDGRVIYLGTGSSNPISLYITPGKSESMALAVTLVPQEIPPRQVTLKLADGVAMPAVQDVATPVSQTAAAQDDVQPYVEAIRGTMRDIALHKVPPGYAYRAFRAGDWAPSCKWPEGVTLSMRGGQVLEGGRFIVVTGVVTNGSDHPVELQESWCGTAAVAAVAYWPRNLLEPKGKTELLVMRRRVAPTAREPGLPALVE